MDGEIDRRFDRLLKANGDARVVAAKIERPGAVSCRVLVAGDVEHDGVS
ncbi:MAG: hypothetical protein IPJ97_15455 [Proteobacteria bacterium]|nr:hypothetical protein [Pseudomonadota bacterium]